MKKFFLSAFAVAAIATAFTSCKKEEAVEPVKTYASISGMAYANLSETNDTNVFGNFETKWETAPEGTKVIAQVYTGDYSENTDWNVNYEYVTYETTVDATGAYSFPEIEAYTSDVNVTIQFSDFGSDTNVWGVGKDSNGNAINVVTTERNVYSVGNQYVSVVANENKVVDVQYGY